MRLMSSNRRSCLFVNSARQNVNIGPFLTSIRSSLIAISVYDKVDVFIDLIPDIPVMF
jgi:hypothetical protein